jgi:hypothetical protein
VAVLATLDGLSKSTDTAVVLLSADQVVPIAREGEQSPVAGNTYKSFSDPVANAEGAVAFTAALNGAAVSKSNGSALFIRNAAGELASLARLGEAGGWDSRRNLEQVRQLCSALWGGLRPNLRGRSLRARCHQEE